MDGEKFTSNGTRYFRASDGISTTNFTAYRDVGPKGGEMSNQHFYGNGPIVRSIPIQKDLKRLIILKFNWLCRHNGAKYASDVFSSARVSCMQLLAKELTQDMFLEAFPLSRKLASRILPSLLSNPHPWLDLLKVYTSFKKPVMSVGASQDAMTDRLRSAKLPEIRFPIREYEVLNRFQDLDLVKYTDSRIDRVEFIYTLPDPSWYKDWTEDRSAQYEDDLCDLPNIVFSREYSWIFDPVVPLLENLMDFEFCPETRFVGQIHHIPKKGTVKRRPIAVPNRFFQTAFQPFDRYLRNIIRSIPSDCTFDQNKFDRLVKSKLDAGDYVGSVDLSAASDNLPRFLALDFLRHFGDDTTSSYCDAIDAICEDNWLNGDTIVHFSKGQPLGLLPSFPLLALTNHICVWIAANRLGMNHVVDQYCLLGDDLLFFNSQLRDEYIDLMAELYVPLSLHKSYQGNLVEFAGKVFIRKQPIAYTPDHQDLRYDSLFDYQSSSKIRIPYSNLPPKLRSRWARGFASQSLAERGYNLVVAYLLGAGPGVNDVALSDLVFNLISDKVEPDEDRKGRVVPIFHGFFVVTAFDGFTSKNAKQTDWWKKKFRNYSVTALRSACQAALAPTLVSV